MENRQFGPAEQPIVAVGQRQTIQDTTGIAFGKDLPGKVVAKSKRDAVLGDGALGIGLGVSWVGEPTK